MLEKTIKNLGFKRQVDFNGRIVNLACLIREEDRRPLQAEWWKGKQSQLIAVDDGGNFFIRHCGGYIFYWDHKQRIEEHVAKSENEFLKMIVMGD